jgi:hypothetical protein
MPLTLRVDTWASDYEGVVLSEEGPPESSVPVDPFVETEHWCPIEPSPCTWPEAITFIDGVRRVDVGGVDEGGEGVAYGLFSTLPARLVLCEADEARIQQREASRRHEAVEIPAGTALPYYRRHAVVRNARNDVLQELQNVVRSPEATLTCQWSRPGALAFVDGPLTLLLPPEEPIPGYVKRHIHPYLEEPEQVNVIYQLPAGSRGPLFRFGEGSPCGYSWYLRLASRRAIEAGLAGIVRLVVLDSVGIDEAIRLADATANLLPQFASHPAWEARAPQNLYPISARENDLHHRLGDHVWIRRAIESHLRRGGEL